MMGYPGRGFLAMAMALASIAARPAPGASPADELRTKLDELAAQVERAIPVVAMGKPKEVAVGDFAGPPQVDANCSPGIAGQLADALAARKVKVDRRAKMTLRGRYAAVPHEAYPDLKVIKLTAELFDDRDESRGTFTTRFSESATIAALLGTTVSLSPDGDLKTRNLEVVGSSENPQAAIQETRIRSKPTSPFALEIFARPANAAAGQTAVAKVPTLRDGQPFVALDRGETYEIRLHNSAPYMVATTVAIDGIDSFRFCEERGKGGQPRFSFYPVHPGKTFDVKGWFRNLKVSDSFLVTAYGQGASSALPNPQPGKSGVITAAFRACAESKEKLPADEQVVSRGGQTNETGFGPSITTALQPVSRVLGEVRDVISVRYTH
ncbi:MAG: hypothetical protein U0800_02040 [Isosphaeraceae bacterium]